jgi:competence protein ComEA
MSSRALGLAALLVASPTAVRLAAAPAPERAPCTPEGRGLPPRHWVACTGDPGAARPLDGPQRLALGLPLDVNRATAGDLAAVPGLSARLGEEIVQDRGRRGPFRTLDELVRVRGIGPSRLVRARAYLVAGPAVGE